MPTTPGWYPDPTDLPFQRYWDGQSWTEHTHPMPAPPTGNSGAFATARLPYMSEPSVKANRQWYQRKGVVIGGSVVGALIVLGAIGAAIGPSPKNAADAGGEVTPSSSVPSIETSAPSVRRSVTPAPEPTIRSKTRRSSAAAPADGSWTMPNEVGQILQDAQDDLQRVSGDPAFFSHSHDLLGDRFQVLDRDWKVCTQNISRGTHVSAVEHIDFGVVKLDESCP